MKANPKIQKKNGTYHKIPIIAKMYSSEFDWKLQWLLNRHKKKHTQYELNNAHTNVFFLCRCNFIQLMILSEFASIKQNYYYSGILKCLNSLRGITQLIYIYIFSFYGYHILNGHIFNILFHALRYFHNTR